MAFAIAVWIGLAAIVVTALVVGWRARHGLMITAFALVAVAAIWIAAKIASDRDYRDADGWADCWPGCSALQRAVGISLTGGTVLGVALVVAFAVALIRRRR
jgi:hypothetical protein